MGEPPEAGSEAPWGSVGGNRVPNRVRFRFRGGTLGRRGGWEEV